jgi:hypothetical protein
MAWEQLTTFGIEVNGPVERFNAGHVSDLLTREDAVLVGAHMSGVWLVIPGTATIPLSRDWDNPDILCLAADRVISDHFYAGCGWSGANPFAVGALYETDRTKSAPLANAWNVVSIPADAGSVYGVVVLPSPHLIVMACTGGIYWASVPSDLSPYAWNKATDASGKAVDGPFSGVAIGPRVTVMAAAYGAGGTHFGLFRGEWRTVGSPLHRELVLSKASITGVDAAKIFRTSIASCDQHPQFAYAACAAGDGSLLAVIKTENGGNSWTACSNNMSDTAKGKLQNACGGQGDWNNCVGVAPDDPKKVLVGWLTVCLSNDSGNTWRMITATWKDTDDPGWDARVHTDFHAIRFDSVDTKRIYLCSDGGVCMSPDDGATFITDYNEHLSNLEFLGSPGYRQFSGTLGVSTSTPGLVAGGLMDNGNVYTQTAPELTTWKKMDGGDGGYVVFSSTSQFLRRHWNDPNVKQARWDPASKTVVGSTYIPLFDKAGIVDRINAVPVAVRAPTWTNAKGQLMYAVGVFMRVYGAFADADGSNLHWEIIAEWPASGTASRDCLAVRRGNRIFYQENLLDNVGTEIAYGNGALEDGYLVGDWAGTGRDAFAVRRGNKLIYQKHIADMVGDEISYGDGNAEDEYLVGDWTGSGKDTLAVRRDNKILYQKHLTDTISEEVSYGNGNSEDGYLVGDWAGFLTGGSALAVRRGNRILYQKALTDSVSEEIAYGNGDLEDQYLVGDWTGDRKSKLAVRRGNQIIYQASIKATRGDSVFFGDGNDEDQYLVGKFSKDERVTAVGSATGRRIWWATRRDGTKESVLYTTALSDGKVSVLSTGLDRELQINHIVPVSDRQLYLTASRTDIAPRGNGTVMRSDDGGAHWATAASGLPNEVFYAMECDVHSLPAAIYVATDDQVYASIDEGLSWKSMSTGLPRRPHCADLRIGTSDLYLSTFGASVWRMNLR